MAKKRILEGTDYDRARMLLDEGMPASWIAEDLDCRRKSLFRSGLPSDPDASAQWRSVWGQIRRNPVLYALHQEIGPRSEFRV